jgi:hypothetical protein
MRNYQSSDWRKFSDGALELHDRFFDFTTSRNHDHSFYIRSDGSREEYGVVLRYYTLQELIAMCQRAGLQFKKAYGTFAQEPYGLNTQRCILVAEKVNLLVRNDQTL